MATTSAVLLASPDQSPDSGFYVHYDGDVVGDELGRLIERDGYAKVFSVFHGQPSRFWRHIDPDTGDALPEFVARFPQNIPVSRAVPGYGVLLVGDEEIKASSRVGRIDPATDMERGYSVNRTGAISTVR